MCTNFSVPTPTILVSEMTEKNQIKFITLDGKICTYLNENPSNFIHFFGDKSLTAKFIKQCYR